MVVLKLCGIAFIGVAAALVLKSLKSELSVFAGIVTGIVLLIYAIRSLDPVFSFTSGVIEDTGFGIYLTTILKALGICVVSQSTADVCRDCGEGAIASKIEFAAKALILLLGLPVIKNLLALTYGILSE